MLLDEPMMEIAVFSKLWTTEELTEKLIDFSVRFIVMNFGTLSQRMAFLYPFSNHDAMSDIVIYVNQASKAYSGSQVSSLTVKKAAKKLTLQQFIRSIVKDMQLSIAQFLLGIYYLHRLKSWNTELEGDVCVIAPRLFLAAMMCSTKFTLDHAYLNKTWAKIGGLYSTSGINQMEVEFLKYLEYRLAVNETEFAEFIVQVDQDMIDFDSSLYG